MHAASHKFEESEISGTFDRSMVDLCLHGGGTQYNHGIDVLCRNDSDVQRLPLIDILKNDEQLEIEEIQTHSDPISSDNTPGLEEGNVEDSFEQYFTPESAIRRKSIGIKRKFIDDSEACGSGSDRCMKTTATGKGCFRKCLQGEVGDSFFGSPPSPGHTFSVYHHIPDTFFENAPLYGTRFNHPLL